MEENGISSVLTLPGEPELVGYLWFSSSASSGREALMYVALMLCKAR